jgi:hypothetical protein
MDVLVYDMTFRLNLLLLSILQKAKLAKEKSSLCSTQKTERDQTHDAAALTAASRSRAYH